MTSKFAKIVYILVKLSTQKPFLSPLFGCLPLLIASSSLPSPSPAPLSCCFHIPSCVSFCCALVLPVSAVVCFIGSKGSGCRRVARFQSSVLYRPGRERTPDQAALIHRNIVTNLSWLMHPVHHKRLRLLFIVGRNDRAYCQSAVQFTWISRTFFVHIAFFNLSALIRGFFPRMGLFLKAPLKNRIARQQGMCWENYIQFFLCFLSPFFFLERL